MSKPLVCTKTIGDFPHNRPTTTILEQITFRHYGSEYRNIGGVPTHEQRGITPNAKSLLKMDFLEPIHKTGQQLQGVTRRGKCDVIQAISNKNINSHPQIVPHNLPQTNCVKFVCSAVYKGRVDITCLIVAYGSTTVAPTLPRFIPASNS